MKPLCFLFAFFSVIFLRGQSTIPNPYASIGKPAPKVATLCNGVYDEFLLKDSLVLINGDAISRKTGQLVYSQEKQPEIIVQLQKAQDEKYRFLSVDPLTKGFPQLTPYQFASDRPIDGIDLDGLEYVYYDIFIDEETGTSQIKVSRYNENDPRAYGAMGPGVLYRYYSTGGTFDYRLFKSRQEELPWYAKSISSYEYKDYGLYYGPTSLYKPAKMGMSKVYDYTAMPIDAVDFGAYNHDIGYDKNGAVGADALNNDWSVTPTDQAAVNTWEGVVKLGLGGKDPYNGTKITQTELNAAQNGITYFKLVINKKQFEISNWMYQNVDGAIKTTNFGSDLPSDKAIKFNYELFLKMYMEVDSDGFYVKKNGMWDNDNNPIPQKKK